MANYALTALAKAQPKLIEKFASTELREIDPVTFKALRRSSEIMFPSHKVLRTREDRPIEAGYFTRTKRALGAGRSHAPAGVTGVSGILTPSFTTYSDPFSISLKQMDDNTFSEEEAMAALIENCLKNFSAGNESMATSFIFTNRSAKNIAVAEGTFVTAGGNNTFEVQDAANGNRFMQIIDSAMAENYYGGMAMTIFCDTIAFNKFAFQAKQGISNYQNTSFQFEGKTYVKSLGLTALAATLNYTKGFCIAGADGTFGMLDWIPVQNRTGIEKAPYTYSSFINPIDDCDYAVFSWYVAADKSATGGYTQDIDTTFEFSIDLAPEIAPTDIAGAGETALLAFALV